MPPVAKAIKALRKSAVLRSESLERPGRGRGRAPSARLGEAMANPVVVSQARGGSPFRLADAFRGSKGPKLTEGDLLLKDSDASQRKPFFLGRFSPSPKPTIPRIHSENSPKDQKVPGDGFFSRGLKAFTAGFGAPMMGLPMMLLMGFLRRSGRRSRLTRGEKEKLKEIYNKNPEVKTAIKNLGWSSRQEHQFLTLIAEKAWKSFDGYKDLPKTLEAIERTDWNSAQTYQFLTNLAEKAEKTGAYVIWVFEGLAQALLPLEKTGWSYEQKTQFLLLLAEKAGKQMSMAYRVLPSAILGLRETSWSLEQKAQFLTLLAEKTGIEVGTAYQNLESVTKVLGEYGFSSEQKYLFLQLLTEEGGQSFWARDTSKKIVLGLKCTRSRRPWLELRTKDPLPRPIGKVGRKRREEAPPWRAKKYGRSSEAGIR